MQVSCLLTSATAFAATGYGVMVGTLAKNEHRAAIMVSVPSFCCRPPGIWVPSYVMPVMRNISAPSPLNWSLEGFINFSCRESWSDMLGETLKLLLFFLATMTVTSIANRKKNRGMDEQRIINEIKNYVEKNILAPSVTIDADTDLKSAGIDSFSTVKYCFSSNANSEPPYPTIN